MAKEKINTTVSCRLRRDVFDEVVRLGELCGLNQHEYARTLIVRALGMQEGPEFDPAGLEDAFELIQESLADFRLAMGRGIGAILQDVSPKRNKEEIRQWVLERIIKPSTKNDGEGESP